MSDKQQTLGFWNNSLVGLGVLFVIPALLVVGGFFVIALNGRPAGGIDANCERTVGELLFRTQTYTYSAGLTAYQQQTLSSSSDEGETWQVIFDDVVQAPEDLPCNEAITVVQRDDDYLAWHRKNVALYNAESWQVQNVCDEPRLDSGRCDEDEYDFVDAILDSDRSAVEVRRFVVDEYGQWVSADGSLRIAEAYTITTTDGGISWELQADAAGS